MSTKAYLQRDKFPQCCGATILSGFGHNWKAPEETRKEKGWPTLKQIEKFLAVKELNLGTETAGDNWHEMSRNVWHMAILNEGQKGVLHNIFIAAGFKLVSSGKNKHSHNLNYLYIRKVAH